MSSTNYTSVLLALARYCLDCSRIPNIAELLSTEYPFTTRCSMNYGVNEALWVRLASQGSTSILKYQHDPAKALLVFSRYLRRKIWKRNAVRAIFDNFECRQSRRRSSLSSSFTQGRAFLDKYNETPTPNMLIALTEHRIKVTCIKTDVSEDGFTPEHFRDHLSFPKINSPKRPT